MMKNYVEIFLIFFCTKLVSAEEASSRDLASYPTNNEGVCVKEFRLDYIERCGLKLFSNDGQLLPGARNIFQVCCEGYETYKYDDKICIPKCENGCKNGQCIKPNVCICNPDFVPSYDTGECTSICPFGCLNGNCHANGTCSCKPGYQLELNKKFCIPICTKTCGSRQYCSGPEICSCKKGYILNSQGKCQPICKLNCLHGKCVDINRCECNPGYTLKDGVCQANCTFCESGTCLLNGICSCHPGYTFDIVLKQCVPVCSSCSNGVCVQPNLCQCHPGYKKENGKCVPICAEGCNNGVCISPNLYLCNDGFARAGMATCAKLVCGVGILSRSCVLHNLGIPGFWKRIIPFQSIPKDFKYCDMNYTISSNENININSMMDVSQGIQKVIVNG